MRMALPLRVERLSVRLPRPTVYTALELLLLALLAAQCARLIWTALTPVGPVGEWRPASAIPPVTAASSAPGSFDPFFRLSSDSGPAVVTSLDLTLHGIREDRATGRGSAIIGLPDGEQGSFAVGEEIMPGVTLSAVAFDSVTISRNGAAEQIFLDQSPPAETVAPSAPSAPSAPAAPAAEAVASPEAAARQIQFQPRLENGRVTGIVVQPAGSGDAFRAAGFAPGDVIVSVNGRRIASPEQARALIERSRGALNIVVDRSGRAVPLSVRLNQ